MTFNFVNDEQIKEMLIRDYTELETCLNNRASKSVLILSGSILEAVLIDFFSSKTTDASDIKKLYTESLGNLIDKAKNEKLIDEKHKNFSSGIQGYRNLIHPGREVRLKEKFDFDTASLSFSALKLILKEIEIKSLSSKGRSASEIFNKLINEGLSVSLFNMIVGRINKNEKNKLFLDLVDDDMGNNGPQFIDNPDRYATQMVNMIDSEIFHQLASRLILEIESGSQIKAIKYVKYLYQRLPDYFDEKDLAIVKAWMLGEIKTKVSDTGQMEFLMYRKVLEGLMQTDRAYISEYDLRSIGRSIAFNFSNKDRPLIYLDSWKILHNYLDENAYSELISHLSSYSHFELLLAEYDNGDYLPF